MSSLKMGFIGLGDLGMPMAKGIVQAGIPITVYDLRKEAIDEMVALGAKAAATCREVGEESDAVISMVRDIPQTDEVLFKKDGLWEGVKEGSIIILSSTIGPEYPRKLYARAKEKGVQVIDVGVSKSGPTNEVGGLTLMIGGDDDAVKKCWPAFDAMAKYPFHVGGIGTGQAFKLVNNLLGITIGSVNRECLNLGLRAGLDLARMVEVMSVSTGSSWMLKMQEHMMKLRASGVLPLPRPPAPTIREGKPPSEDIGTKDKRLAIEMAEALGVDIPITRFIESLDMDSVYEAYATSMRR